MEFNRARYASETHYLNHQAAWVRLLDAIEFEEKGDMGKARLSLVMACHKELDALGFKSSTAELLRTTPMWTKPRLLN